MGAVGAIIESLRGDRPAIERTSGRERRGKETKSRRSDELQWAGSSTACEAPRRGGFERGRGCREGQQGRIRNIGFRVSTLGRCVAANQLGCDSSNLQGIEDETKRPCPVEINILSFVQNVEEPLDQSCPYCSLHPVASAAVNEPRNNSNQPNPVIPSRCDTPRGGRVFLLG